MAIPTPWNDRISVAFSNTDITDTYPQGAQVAGLSNGGFVVVWEFPDEPYNDDGPLTFDPTGMGGVCARLFDSNGALLSGTEPIEVFSDIADYSLHFHPVVTAVPGDGGGFIVACMDNTSSQETDYDVIAKSYTENGDLMGERSVISGLRNATRDHLHPAIMALDSNVTGQAANFAVAWQDRTSSDDIKLKLFDAGDIDPEPITIFNDTGSDADEGRNPDIARLANGNLIISFLVTPNSGSSPRACQIQRRP